MIKFHIDCNSFELSGEGLVTGKIHVDVNNERFPEENWNDFVIVILNWWSIKLSEFVSGNSQRATLSFMDGPFGIKLIDNKGISLVSVVHKHQERVVLKEDSKVLKAEILKSFLEVSNKSLEICENNGWAHNEIDKLKSHHKVLEQLQERR
jgi:hypothetical protein